MNALIENNYIKEIECGSNFSYILNDNSTFLSTEYKVLQSQANSCFVKCMKMMYNGKVPTILSHEGIKVLFINDIVDGFRKLFDYRGKYSVRHN